MKIVKPITDLSIVVFSYNNYQDQLIYCLRSIQKNAPEYKELLIVWDDFVRDRPIDFAAVQEDFGGRFRVIMQSELAHWPDAIGRWGWIKQQLAKLLCYRYVSTSWIWIVDGDTLIIDDPNLFAPDGRPYLRYDNSRSTSEGYVKFINRYLGIHDTYHKDFVGSTMLFDRTECEKLHAHIESTTGRSMIDCVNETITEPECHSHPFSEFETYGSWIYHTNLESHVLAERNWNNLPYERLYNQPIQNNWQTYKTYQYSTFDQQYHALMEIGTK